MNDPTHFMIPVFVAEIHKWRNSKGENQPKFILEDFKRVKYGSSMIHFSFTDRCLLEPPCGYGFEGEWRKICIHAGIRKRYPGHEDREGDYE